VAEQRGGAPEDREAEGRVQGCYVCELRMAAAKGPIISLILSSPNEATRHPT